MPKKKDRGRLLVLRKLPKKQRWLSSRQQQVRPPNFLLGIFQRTRKNFRRLRRTHVRARQKQIRRHPERRYTFRHLFGLLDAFFGQISFRVGRALWILTVNRDPVANNIELHDSLSNGHLETRRATILKSARSFFSDGQLSTVDCQLTGDCRK